MKISKAKDHINMRMNIKK